MNITENEKLKNKIVKLASNKVTGTPKELVGMLGISERNLYRIIDSLKDEGINIRYSRLLKTYIID